MVKKVLLLIGPQGSGKGTQSRKLAEFFKLPHISTGELLRNEIKNKTQLGEKIKDNLEKGELVPNVVIEDMVILCLSQYNIENGFIFDGFPRNIKQSEFFMEIMKGKNFDINIICIEIADDVAINRMMLRARADDTNEKIQRRLSIFHTETKPLIKYFEENTDVKVIKVNGELESNEVFNSIILKLGVSNGSISHRL